MGVVLKHPSRVLIGSVCPHDFRVKEHSSFRFKAAGVSVKGWGEVPQRFAGAHDGHMTMPRIKQFESKCLNALEKESLGLEAEGNTSIQVQIEGMCIILERGQPLV
jgi:hypothetical protein